MIDYETRKHYEAALSDLANMFGFDPRGLRNEFKLFLIREKFIIKSTTELTDEKLKTLADKLSTYHHRMEGRSHEERGLLEFKNILKIKINPNLPHNKASHDTERTHTRSLPVKP